MFVVYSFLKEIFSPQGHDRVVTIKSRYFFYCESLVLSGFFILVYRGCNLVAHASIHVYCSLTSVSPDWILYLYYTIPIGIAGNHRLSLLVHHSSLYHHSLGSIPLEVSFLLSRKHAPFRCESC